MQPTVLDRNRRPAQICAPGRAARSCRIGAPVCGGSAARAAPIRTRRNSRCLPGKEVSIASIFTAMRASLNRGGETATRTKARASGFTSPRFTPPETSAMAGLLACGSSRPRTFPGAGPVAFPALLVAHSCGGSRGLARTGAPHSLFRRSPEDRATIATRMKATGGAVKRVCAPKGPLRGTRSQAAPAWRLFARAAAGLGRRAAAGAAAAKGKLHVDTKRRLIAIS
ncbi:conserved hypothetical protein [Rhodobacter capsulatus SB 1003]|uniref:Uncharacterized protein n=1 Tax=Rhodobacter capsulatus (strain ATCC BAA-309 / NBRC 16581 / SB1003) TaxID=272942 RepID=D5AS43_RHOCB|nr:conserved hypothetical protein [Rhodobacter capsulatus SB 1003]